MSGVKICLVVFIKKKPKKEKERGSASLFCPGQVGGNQVVGLIRERKLHHWEWWEWRGRERENKAMQSESKREGGKVATRHKYICTYKAVLMRAKLI